MHILVLNSGSSSLKYKLLQMPEERLLHSGRIEKIGESGTTCFFESMDKALVVEDRCDCPNHEKALELVFAALLDPKIGFLKNREEIGAVGHRVVHGRDLFTEPLLVSDENLAQMKGLIDLAPLHLPANIACIEACRRMLPRCPQIAHFDTAFFRKLTKQAYLYPLPLEWHEKYGVRRYGFHGISYDYVTQEASKLLGRPLSTLRLIATHLGNGASMMAFEQGRPVETSMGFTPMEGLMMGTRPGTIDAAIIPYVMAKTHASLEEIMRTLNHGSGLAAVSGIGRDLRLILSARGQGNTRADLAFRMFIHSLRKYLGAYFFVLRGADVLIFTGGIGENTPEVRAALLEGLDSLGMEIDEKKNREVINGLSGFISTDRSPVKILVIPTNEEIVIARSAFLKAFLVNDRQR
ncbi:MAG: acetate kinase [Deltaproteobacteria bacterium]|nr:acetate kinase [Deltaproteobacteria bacterium]